MVRNTRDESQTDNAALADPPHNYAGDGTQNTPTGRRMEIEDTNWVEPQGGTPPPGASATPSPDGPPVPEEDAEGPEAQLRPSKGPMLLPEPTSNEIPEWAKVPAGMKFPKGKQVIFMRFRPGMTDTPSKGERQAIIWSNSIGDQKLAYIRADKDPNKMSEQLAKQTVRSIDGLRVDWSGEITSANIDTWWDEIGPKSRGIIDKLYMQLHYASRDEAVDFFENCVAVRVVAG